jgi:hypothetical protein
MQRTTRFATAALFLAASATFASVGLLGPDAVAPDARRPVPETAAAVVATPVSVNDAPRRSTPPAAIGPRARPLELPREIPAADFDPGYGEMLPSSDDGPPSPSPEDIAREEEALARATWRAPSLPGSPPDFRRLGYASEQELEASIRRAFGISADRHVALREIDADGRRRLSITVAPRPRAQRGGSLAGGQIHRLEPIVVAQDREIEIELASDGDAEAYVAIGEEPTEFAYGWRLDASASSDAIRLPARSGETVHVMVKGGDRDGEYALRVE